MRLSLRCVIWCVMLAGQCLALPRPTRNCAGMAGRSARLAVSADGMTALSGSFDTSAIRWSLRDNLAEQVLRLHESAVNAVAILNDGRAVTGGADALIGIWTPGKPVPDAILRGHEGPIVALAVSPDGATLASASWDRTVRLWPLAGGPPIVLKDTSRTSTASPSRPMAQRWLAPAMTRQCEFGRCRSQPLRSSRNCRRPSTR